MQEVPLCIHCRMPIDKQTEEYVVTNKDEESKESRYLYAHEKCQKENLN